MHKNLEKQRWRTEKENHTRLWGYPKEELGTREEYIARSEESKLFCKFRINDVSGWKEEKKCIKCKRRDRVVQHILLECEELTQIRQDTGMTRQIEEGTAEEKTKEDIIKQLLNNDANKKQIAVLYRAWKQGQEDNTTVDKEK